jgi:biopolymer transport protein ExbD
MAEMNTSDSGGGKRHKGGKRSKKMSTRVDMTPMVDLAFLLVTFFMLTTTFNKPTIMDVKMPAKINDIKDQTELKASESMTVLLGGGDSIFYYMGLPTDPATVVEQSSYAADGIRKVIADKKQDVIAANPTEKNPDRLSVLIKATPRSNYKNIVDMFDEMSIIQVRNYALVDLDKTDQGLLDKKIGISAPPASN